MKNVQVKLFARWKDELAVIGFHLWLKLHKVNDCLFDTLPGACAARECSHNPSGCWEAVDHSSNVFLPRGPTLVTWRGLRGVRDRTELSAFYSNRGRTNTNIVILYLFWLASVTHLLISWTSCMNLRWDWLLWELRWMEGMFTWEGVILFTICLFQIVQIQTFWAFTWANSGRPGKFNLFVNFCAG